MNKIEKVINKYLYITNFVFVKKLAIQFIKTAIFKDIFLLIKAAPVKYFVLVRVLTNHSPRGSASSASFYELGIAQHFLPVHYRNL